MEHVQRTTTTSLKANLILQIISIMLPAPATASENNHRAASFVRLQRLARRTSTIQIERSWFILIHFLFYIVLLTILWTKLDQFNRRQEDFLDKLQRNPSAIIHSNRSYRSNL